MKPLIHIRSARFPILPGEAEELVNEGTYGKALAQYLQARLRERGYESRFVGCEDWGWWVDLTAPFKGGVCVYSGPKEKDGPVEFACTDGFVGPKKWSFKHFRFVDVEADADRLHADLLAIFEADPEVEILAVTDEFPF